LIQIQIPVLHVKDMTLIQMPALLEESAMIQTLITVLLEEREKTLIKAHHENVTIQTQILVLLEEQEKTRMPALLEESVMIQILIKVH
jgi:hypothetical protein